MQPLATIAIANATTQDTLRIIDYERVAELGMIAP
jgi:hypothetical protein